MAAVTWFEHVGRMPNFRFSVDRDMMSADWHLGSLDVTTTSYQRVTWEETVVHKIDGNKDASFKLSTSQDAVDTPYVPFFTAGWVMFELGTDLLVKHWEEYVYYSYIDWFMAMGGLISFAATAFFMFASVLARAFNNHSSLGVLPKFSIEYRNRQKIRSLEKTVQKLLELLSYSNGRHTTDKKVLSQDDTTKTSFVASASCNRLPSNAIQAFREDSKVRGQKNAWGILQEGDKNEPELPGYIE